MITPAGKTEEEVLAAIEKAVRLLSRTFAFGYFDREDMEQEGRVFALEALASGKYDPSRPLENFLYSHIKNQFINLKRNKLRRCDPPCAKCHAGEPCADGAHCAKYRRWHDRNQAKANLMCPLGLGHVADDRERRARVESRVVEDAEVAEMVRRVDESLPVELRGVYLQMRAGVAVPKARRAQVEAAVKEILGALSGEDFAGRPAPPYRTQRGG